MAQFFGLMPLNAANFESGAATDGQVLTADGAGGAAWQAAAGGGWKTFVELDEDDTDLTLTAEDNGTIVKCVTYHVDGETVGTHYLYLPPAALGLQFLIWTVGGDGTHGAPLAIFSNGSDTFNGTGIAGGGALLLAVQMVSQTIISQFVGFPGGWLVLPISSHDIPNETYAYWMLD